MEEMNLPPPPTSPVTEGAAVHLPSDIGWQTLDKSRFFLLGATLFSGLSAALYPAVVLKTRLQVSPLSPTTAVAILRREGPSAFYRGFATSLAGTIPARALYMAALETARPAALSAFLRLGAPDPAAAAAAAAAAGLSAAVAAQLVWTPIDVVTQRLMVQDATFAPARYAGGLDAFAKIGLRGLYRGFGMSILTYAPSNAVWWASYSLSQQLIWGGVGWCYSGGGAAGVTPGVAAVAVVQGLSAAAAGGAAAVVTMPLDTIKTRMQVMDGGEEEGVGGAVRRLVREGGWRACYRGLGPRWVSMSLSAMAMITTYEFVKRMSAKPEEVEKLAGECGI